MTKQVEIERKWLVDSDVDISVFNIDDSAPVEHIRQSYFADNVRVRLSRIGSITTASFTIKISETVHIRHEYNQWMCVAKAEDLWLKVGGIEKRRLTCMDGYTLDRFDGSLSGLILLEKEYASIEDLNKDVIPDHWPVVDVTESDIFTNANLIGKSWNPVTGLFISSTSNIQGDIITGDTDELHL